MCDLLDGDCEECLVDADCPEATRCNNDHECRFNCPRTRTARTRRGRSATSSPAAASSVLPMSIARAPRRSASIAGASSAPSTATVPRRHRSAAIATSWGCVDSGDCLDPPGPSAEIRPASAATTRIV
jgi:hypothetical protein